MSESDRSELRAQAAELRRQQKELAAVNESGSSRLRKQSSESSRQAEALAAVNGSARTRLRRQPASPENQSRSVDGLDRVLQAAGAPVNGTSDKAKQHAEA
ncbi:unnamed protein product [Prorocentrum cordatum]|uniref:Uncharacterized protein n=1 Tax=Prorocentrum cordatum TaxID=2364126 RepID=A0ABN9X8Q0_9DINO|nr:unnamed protein product [Polarella glacialis]